MADVKSDKKTESLNALKNANKHLSDLFADLNKKDLTLQTCSSDLGRVAAQCGDLRVSVWIVNQTQLVSLKTYLETIAKSLNEAR